MPLDPKRRARVTAEAKRNHRFVTQEFQEALLDAKRRLPNQAKDPLFAFTILRLWRPHFGDGTAWLADLPDRYNAFRAQHGWLIETTKTDGSVEPRALTSLARLLVAVHNRRRFLEQ